MSDIAINPVTRRVQFTGNTGTGPFAFTFNVLNSSDIAVYKNTTLLTLTADYTVTIAANGTGSVTLQSGQAVISSDYVTIIGGRNLERTTDFVTAGDLLASSLNEQLDSNVIMSQQLDESFGRALSVSPGDVDVSMTLPSASSRANQIVAFTSTGAVTTTNLNDLPELTVDKLNVDNITLDGNTISTTDSNGNLTLTPNGTGDVVVSGDIVINGTTTTNNFSVSVVSISDGSSSAPSLTNTGNTNTGLFFPANNQVGISASASEIVNISTTGVKITPISGADALVLNNNDTSINDNNAIARIIATADDPTADQEGAEILFLSAGAWSTNSYPTEIVLRTDNGGSLTNRMVVGSTGIDVTGTVTADGLTVDGNASLSGTSPHLTFYETDLADTNTRISTQTRKFRIGTVTDAGGSFTERFQIDHNTGDVSFYEDTGTTPKMVWKSADERLGIGTSSPTYALDVETNNSGGLISSFVNTATSIPQGVLIDFPNATPNATNRYFLKMEDSTSVKAEINTTGGGYFMGDVGIGTDSPASKLHLQSTNSSVLKLETTSANTYPGINFINDAQRYDMQIDGATDAFRIYDNTSSATRFVLDTSGNVGIGATSISGVLTLQKNQAASSTAGTGTTLTLNGDANAGNPWEIFRDNGVTGDLVFSQDASGTRSEAMRLSSSGSVGIGTSSPSPDYGSDTALEIKGASSPGIVFNDTGQASKYGIHADSNDLKITYGTGALATFQNDGKVGIGTSSPSAKVMSNVNTFTDADKIAFKGYNNQAVGVYANFQNTTTGTGFADGFRLGIDDSENAQLMNGENTAMTFATSATEAMRLDASGNLLVGKTSTNTINTVGHDLTDHGEVMHTTDGGTTMYLNRKTSDGTIVDLRKDGSTVGSIGTIGGGMYIGDGDTGLEIDGANNAIYPFNTSTLVATDGHTDLGDSDKRFTDLYLSGGVYLGGTGLANKLDHYETGSWTPVVVGSTSAGTGTYQSRVGKYTKIGNRVLIEAQVFMTAHTGSGNFLINGLPFASRNEAPSGYNFARPLATSNSYLNGAVDIVVNNNTTSLTLVLNPQNGASVSNYAIDGLARIRLSGHYDVA